MESRGRIIGAAGPELHGEDGVVPFAVAPPPRENQH